MAGLTGNERVLEVGCGTGTLTVVAAKALGPQGSITGLDAAQEMINVARRKAEQKGLPVEFVVAPVEGMPFENDEFNIVFSSMMLHHLPGLTKRQAVVEIARVLEPGGRFEAVDFDPGRTRYLGRFAERLIGRVMIKNNLSLVEDYLTEQGFCRIERGKTDFLGIRWIRGDLLA